MHLDTEYGSDSGSGFDLELLLPIFLTIIIVVDIFLKAYPQTESFVKISR
jgi:hypothetical protein